MFVEAVRNEIRTKYSSITNVSKLELNPLESGGILSGSIHKYDGIQLPIHPGSLKLLGAQIVRY